MQWKIARNGGDSAGNLSAVMIKRSARKSRVMADNEPQVDNMLEAGLLHTITSLPVAPRAATHL
jgi:hypothetical protein